MLRQIRCAQFYNAYIRLIHAEAHLIRHIIDSDAKIWDIAAEHNILETAKQQVVRQYLPFQIKGE